MITQDQLDTFYGRVCKAKKGTKEYWMAKADFSGLQAQKNLEDLYRIQEVIEDTGSGDMLDRLKALEIAVKEKDEHIAELKEG
jgi:hypothetical protein